MSKFTLQLNLYLNTTNLLLTIICFYRRFVLTEIKEGAMKLKVIFISAIITLSSFTGAKALSPSEVSVVSAMHVFLMGKSENFQNVTNATNAINDVLAQVEDNSNIISDNKNSILYIILLIIKNENIPSSIFNSAIANSNIPYTLKVSILNNEDLLSEGAKPILNSPS